MKEKRDDKNDIIASKKDAEIFFNTIFNPREPNKKLKKAFKEYSKILDKS